MNDLFQIMLRRQRSAAITAKRLAHCSDKARLKEVQAIYTVLTSMIEEAIVVDPSLAAQRAEYIRQHL